MTQLKSLAHPDWPYAGTAHEWRGFTEKPKGQMASASYIVRGEGGERVWADGRKVDADYPFVNGTAEQESWDEQLKRRDAIWQKQYFGPELK